MQRISDALHEDEDGAVHIATFELLDDIAEHIDPPALDHLARLDVGPQRHRGTGDDGVRVIDRAHRRAIARRFALCARARWSASRAWPSCRCSAESRRRARRRRHRRRRARTLPDLERHLRREDPGDLGAASSTPAIGNMNAHTAEYGGPTYAGGALTLSASRWAKGPDGRADRRRLARPGAGGERGLAVRADLRVARAARSAADGGSTRRRGRLGHRHRRPRAAGSATAELLATDESGTVDASLADVLDRATRRAVRAAHRPRASSPRRSPRVCARRSRPARRHRHRRPLARARRDRLPDAVSPSATTTRSARSTRRSGELSRDLARQPAERLAAHDRPCRHGQGVVQGARLRPAHHLRRGLPRGDRLVVHTAPGARHQPRHRADDARLARRDDARRDARQAAGVRAAAPATPAALAEQLARDDVAPGVIDQLRDAWVLKWFCYSAIGGGRARRAAGRSLPVGWASRHRRDRARSSMLSALPAAWLMFLAGRQPLDVPLGRACVRARQRCSSRWLRSLCAGSSRRRALRPRSSSRRSLRSSSCADQWTGHADRVRHLLVLGCGRLALLRHGQRGRGHPRGRVDRGRRARRRCARRRTPARSDCGHAGSGCRSWASSCS